jgi:hypothetical protein
LVAARDISATDPPIAILVHAEADAVVVWGEKGPALSMGLRASAALVAKATVVRVRIPTIAALLFMIVSWS